MSGLTVRPLPVLYACKGCPAYGYSAPRVAQGLDRRGLVEAVWLGEASDAVTGRYPIYALDACAERCAADWVHAHGRRVERAFVLQAAERDDPEAAVERIAAAL
jgi:uncharacterized metal-binding protein